MSREEYAMIASLMSKIPPKKETPKGQKFHIGEIVRITNPKSWFAKEYKDKLFQIEYSYCQKYGSSDDRQKKQYSLIHLFEDSKSSWYDESELTVVKAIDEITKESELAELKRLKAKYEVKS